MGGSIPIEITVASSVSFMTGMTGQVDDVEQLLVYAIHEHSALVRRYRGGREDNLFGGSIWISILRLYDSYVDLYQIFQELMNTHLRKLLAFERRLRKSSYNSRLAVKATAKLRASEKQLMKDINYKIMKGIKTLESIVTYHRIALSKIFEKFSSGQLTSDELSPHEIIFLATHIEPISSTIRQHLQFLRAEAIITSHSLEVNKIKKIPELEQASASDEMNTNTTNSSILSQTKDMDKVVIHQKSSSSIPSSESSTLTEEGDFSESTDE